MVEIKSILPLKRSSKWVININYINEWMDELYSFDSYDIIDILNIPKHIYIQTLLKEFDGNLSSSFNICFNNEENCQRAIDWIYSQIVFNKLIKERNG